MDSKFGGPTHFVGECVSRCFLMFRFRSMSWKRETFVLFFFQCTMNPAGMIFQWDIGVGGVSQTWTNGNTAGHPCMNLKPFHGY